MSLDDSTLQGVGVTSGVRPGYWASRFTLGLLGVVVAAGAIGILGVHTSRVTESAGGYRLALDYPRTARAGLDVEWRATVTHPGGFDKTVTLAVTGDYFNIFETQGFFPQPDSQTRSGETLFMTFLAPPGDTLVVDYDAYIQPSSQRGRDGTLSVMSGGSQVASVSFATWLAP